MIFKGKVLRKGFYKGLENRDEFYVKLFLDCFIVVDYQLKNHFHTLALLKEFQILLVFQQQQQCRKNRRIFFLKWEDRKQNTNELKVALIF